MSLQSLDHFLVYASDLEVTKQFYVDTLGLELGVRPPFGFPGYWLYLEGRAVVHLAGDDGSGNYEKYLEKPKVTIDGGTGALDHIAFRCGDFDNFRTKLDSLDISYTHKVVPDFELQQLFVKDPDGLRIELNFFD
ncbi:MAG: catechol 2,3-dioxygenase-like lactoylglutathione lyase family enzyme [Gammaproteobacteria bacterium]|jgi:catechol 2,3-dioxygenase-like lactoylglutathione lyase family enzyme